MYHLYIKKESGFDRKKLIGEFKDFDQTQEKLKAELAKDKDLKYVIEETTGKVDGLGEFIVDVIEEN